MEPEVIRDLVRDAPLHGFERHLRSQGVLLRVVIDRNFERLLGQIEQARDRVLARINGPAKVGMLPKGDNSFANPYRPNFLGDCCFKGQNTSAPEYALRP